MKILVIGVGGIGGFIGSYLVNNNFDVTFIARKKRLIFLKSNGLKLESKLDLFLDEDIKFNLYC